MGNKNIWDPNTPDEPTIPKDDNKSKGDMLIVFYNLLALVFYTVICAIYRSGGVFADAFLIAMHAFACLILTAVSGKKVWILSGFLVLLIGFSTCAGILWNLN